MSPETCKYYNGSLNTHCLAGVCYRDVTTDPDNNLGIAFRSPCIDWPRFKAGNDTTLSAKQLAEFNRRGTCAKREEPTAQEMAEHEDVMKAHQENFSKVDKLIGRLKKQHDESWAGVERCPVCCGVLRLKLNVFFSEHQGTKQKHMHGKCDTDGCFAWRE